MIEGCINQPTTKTPPSIAAKTARKSLRADRQSSRRRLAKKAAMQAEGSALIGYQPVHGINCFRLIFMNPAVTHDDVDILLDLIARYSEAAWRSSGGSEPLHEPVPLA